VISRAIIYESFHSERMVAFAMILDLHFAFVGAGFMSAPSCFWFALARENDYSPVCGFMDAGDCMVSPLRNPIVKFDFQPSGGIIKEIKNKNHGT
jgi:hypothetical protein